MRADARRNRERILDAAADLVVETGGEPVRDAVAARAGVGIGTLYRHFPDRQSLLRSIALHVLDRNLAAGDAAVEASDDPADALRSYMHLSVENRLGAVHLLHPLIEDTEWPDRRRRAEALLGGMVRRAHEARVLRPEVTVQDIAFTVLRCCRPLSIGLSPADDRAQAHRQVDLCFDGLAGDRSSRTA